MWYHGVLCCDWLHCMFVGGMMPCLYLEGWCAAAGPGVVACSWLVASFADLSCAGWWSRHFGQAPSPSAIDISFSLPYLSLCSSDFLPSATGWPTAGCSSSSLASYWTGAVRKMPPNTRKTGWKISLGPVRGDAGFSDGQCQIG